MNNIVEMLRDEADIIAGEGATEYSVNLLVAAANRIEELESKVGNSAEPKDANNDNMLHVYGHDAPHEPACIVGNRKALEALRASIDCALVSGEDSFYVWDDYGDAYLVTVEVNE